jgi:transcriptional regulator with XRE-family HTH domain
MRDDGLATYEKWDMTAPVVPPRSRFFNLSPAGFGTSMVECLTSYISRLAQAHSVTPGVLHHREVMKHGPTHRNMFACGIKGHSRSFTCCINANGAVAIDFVLAIGKMTARNDLQYLTLLPWKPLLPTPLLMRGVAAWCPACLTSWKQAGKPVYVPLLWTLDVVKFCPFHRRALRVTCPHCSLPQPLLGQCSWVGFCTRCKHWLGSDSGRDNAENPSILRQETPDWEIWVANQIADLIEAGFHSPPVLTTAQLAQLIRRGTDLEGMSGLARILGVSVGSIDHWRMGDRRPTLPVYLRLARVFGVSLVSLLTGKISPAQIDSLDLEGVPHWRNLWARQRFSFDRLKIAHELDLALKEFPPRSLKSFQIRNGYHYATLHKYFPEQCKAIQERFQGHSAAMIRERHAKKIAEFREIAYRLNEQGIELSVNRVLTRMSVPKSLDHRIACELLAEIKCDILANPKPSSKTGGTMTKQRPSPDALCAQTE